MIEQRVRKILQIEYEKRLLIYDTEDFASCFDYALLLRADDFVVYLYDDVERIRYIYETQIRGCDDPCAIIVTNCIYYLQIVIHVVFVNLPDRYLRHLEWF